ncbi:HicB family protein [Limosilactobacillus reuteri]|uniref:HicB family protein n=1 Tax=Limosilactobacillus reuteri TaxID=1598 RepID=A0A256VG80_LIMRT|nr:type II toxin-antitoxin system HicB family antitoxin [Limosilactobacillus reuteri]OYS59521.1 HicB family protein [Limosilactobacillus reuteri]OYS61694.1 HicB family protein [Limosilactobacillus reuteri]OYS65027.1 HicB family protein [Limosilactobacillus reuteri]OYS72374.1 HicB family protein [Limosilactobacillus reuteri]OYS75312.1 HicB family protein [Limosilactobacillus reuteri]
MKNKKIVYPAILNDEYNKNGEYTVTFPDVPAAISQGLNLADALINGAEALGLALYGEKEFPIPTSIEEIKKENPKKIVNYIAVDMNDIKKHVVLPTVKKNTTLPGELAKRAEEAGINFSQTLREALEEKLK